MTGYICMAVFRPDLVRLRAQVASIVGQTTIDWICLVGVDGPDAATVDMVRAVCSDGRFRVLEFDTHAGHFRNFERILARVPEDAAWVALSDQDDVWYPAKLESLVPLLSDSALVQGSARVCQARGRQLTVTGGVTRNTENGLFALFVDNQVTGSFSVLRQQVLAYALPFPDPTDAAYHDHWLGVCASLVGGVKTLPTVLQDYIQHEDNVIGELSAVRVRQRVTALWRRPSPGERLAVGDYLVRHRWGWRVRMARAARARFTGLTSVDDRVLEVFALGTVSVDLVIWMARSVGGRRVPPMRGLALVAAAVWAHWRPLERSRW